MKKNSTTRSAAPMMTLLSTLCFLTCLLTTTAAHAQLTPSADAYTNSADPTTNYGAGVQLDVESTQTTYIQFNLSSIPNTYTSADITQATLKLYVNAVTTAGSFNVDYVNGAWVESTITHTLAPALGTTIVASVPLTTADKNQYILIDVTAAVQAWLSGTPNDGIALVGNSPVNASFDSKENTTTSHPPELDIVFTGALTGVTTASGSGLIGGGTSGTLNLSLTKACAASQVLKWNGTAWVCSSTGTGTITGVTAGADLTGGGTSGTVTLKLNTATVPLLASANTFTASQTVDGNLTATGTVKAATLTATNASVSNTLVITSANGGPLTVTASIPSAEAILGYASASTGDGNGVVGQVSSSDPAAYGVYGYALSSTGSPVGVYGQSNAATGYGVEGTSPNVGVYGSGGTGVYGISAVYGYGVQGVNTDGGTAVVGSGASLSIDGLDSLSATSSGVFGDTPGNNDDGCFCVGVQGTADNAYAGYFLSDGKDIPTVRLQNTNSGGIFEAEGPSGMCTISSGGDLKCSGTVTAVVSANSGARKVALCSMQSPENWFEDFGSGALSGGSATVALDPTFAQTVNTGAEYHVFLTANGDSKGLYVSQKTATSFEVREQGGGHSSIAFDYRIVAKRAGYENVRLADLTEQLNKREAQRQKIQRRVRPSAVPQSSPQVRNLPLPPVRAAVPPLAAQLK
jgi:hypothetical protein